MLSDSWPALGDAGTAVLNSLLGELGSLGPSQHTRLLRFHTPLGRDVLLAERVHITEAIGPVAPSEGQVGTGYAIELLALSTQAGIAPERLMGQAVLLELLTAQSRTDLRPFHGHVTAFELLGSDGGYARYRLRIEPWLSFLAQRTDSWVFQDMSVLEITEAVFADYAGQGRLAPQWLFELAERGVYAKRSLCVQFNETDLAFLQRLWAQEGLFTWFEHHGNTADPSTLGQHTLVIADHNGALVPNAQPRMRYTQSGAAMKQDSITQWHGTRRVGVSELNTASFDYRAVSNQSATSLAEPEHGQPMALVHTDQPGAYAFEDAAQAERLANVHMQALQARRKQFSGLATVRTLAPATTFELADHPEHQASLFSSRAHEAQSETEAQFVVLSVEHRARNNLSADAQAGLQHLLASTLAHSPQANASAEPLYQARLSAQRAHVPVRAAQINDGDDGEDGGGGALPLHPKPTVWGTQTALVVGRGEPVHTDRDGRIKVQFHWQRGSRASHRLSSQSEDNAPANATLGCWVRVGQSWAGANWGAVAIPRLGQEVLISFIEGDIDRPVVVGSTYNGQGSPNAQGNQVGAGAATATGNAPAWFPGSQRQGSLQGHAHTATLSGFKSQSLQASQDGTGGHNQLVLDNTPGQGRVLAHSTQNQTWLQMGHLLQQHDNQRLAPRGHGLELHTQAQGAIRAALGMVWSTRSQHVSSTSGQTLNSSQAQAQLQAHADLAKALGTNAQTHKAQLPNEPAPAEQLPVVKDTQALVASLRTPHDSPAGLGPDGGQGRIQAPDQPVLLLDAAGAIFSGTPANTVVAIGGHTHITTNQDINLLSQSNTAWAVKEGVILFTEGVSTDPERAVQDVGIKLHAASGNVNVQAQSGPFALTALQGIDIQCTNGSIHFSAPGKLIFNGGGSYVMLDGQNIEVGTSGEVQFKAEHKVFAGGAIASTQGPQFTQVKDLFDEQFVIKDETSGQVMAHHHYRIENAKGEVLAQGMSDEQGRTARVIHSKADQVKIYY